MREKKKDIPQFYFQQKKQNIINNKKDTIFNKILQINIKWELLKKKGN